jgi:hypothetical protein
MTDDAPVDSLLPAADATQVRHGVLLVLETVLCFAAPAFLRHFAGQ